MALTGVPVLISAHLLLLALTVVLALGIRETVRVAVVAVKDELGKNSSASQRYRFNIFM